MHMLVMVAYHHMFQPSTPSSGNGGYPWLPTTQLVQHALPIAIATSPCPLGHAPHPLTISQLMK